MKALTYIVAAFSIIWPFNFAQAKTPTKTAYDFNFKTLMGEDPLPLSQYKGKVILVVNTASNCGFTKQYEGLEKLHKKYSKQGLVIIGVPSNDFGGQEPGTNKEIANFCKINYGVSFQMASKEVVSGKSAHPFYLWAKESLGLASIPKWNFHKILISKNSVAKDYFNSTTAPDSKSIIDAIEKELKAK
jgi:glutathione peroxidase